ncbi:hypothetical protein LAZ67_22000907, partial [Cordylochernes scorpioides]
MGNLRGKRSRGRRRQGYTDDLKQWTTRGDEEDGGGPGRLEPTNIGEIKAIIEYLPNKKAPGIDELPNEALKLLPNHILASITEIFNASLQLAHFPDRWKTSIIGPILKKGKSMHEPTSYRPISLLPAISKLFEIIVLRRLRKSLEEKNPLRPEQFGYQAKHSTLHQLVVVTEKIRKAMDLGQITGAVFFDIAKAFDKVWHEALLYKMCKKHLPGDIIKITQNFLTNRTFKLCRLHGRVDIEVRLASGNTGPRGPKISQTPPSEESTGLWTPRYNKTVTCYAKYSKANSFVYVGKSNRRCIIIMLLLMAGIESNPGPRYTKQTTLELDKDKDIGGLITALSAKMDDWGQKIETRFASVEQGLEKINQRLQQLETSLDTTSKVASDNSKRIADLEGRLEHCEMKQRERNLIFYGFEGAENETPDESRSRVLNLISSSMQISEEIGLEQCRRLSRKANSPLLIEVPDYKQRILLLRNAFKLRDKKIFLNKDYPATVREQRKILINKRKELFSRGIVSKLRDNKLIVRGINYYASNGRVVSASGDITDGKELILIGDLNIRTGGLGGLYNPTNLQLSLVSERKARDLVISPLAEGLLEFLEDNSLTIINGRSTGDREGDFTYVSERGSSTIDYCIVSQGILEKILDFRIETQMYSDHLPLILKLTVQNTYENKSKGEEYGVTRYRWTAGGFKTFKQELKELQVVKISNLDSSVNTFTQRITEAMSTSGIMYSTKGTTGKSKPWFDKNCYDMKKLTKESLKEFRRTNRKEDLESYALHRKKYLGLLDDKRRKYIQEKQEILRNIKDSKSFWKTIALFKGATKIQGEITVQEWHEFYCELMSIEEKEKICNIEVRISPSDPILDPEITSEEIGRAIRDLKNNKASGPDDIPNEIIKILPDSYMGLSEQFYNRALIMGHYPTIWTKSIIHPIFKSGDKDNPSNYRGIALISNFSKLFTTILRSRLNEWVERRNVIPENQAGFRRGRSCVDLIFTLTSLIQLSLRKKRGKLYVFFVDLRKAFDTVPHSLLWKKLTNLGVSYQFIHAIRNYYEQATVAVRWRGSITENIKIHSGVLQGEPLSPLLFILFMTDLIKMYDNSDLTSVYLPEFGDVHLLMYADDIAIIGESRLNLQKKINILKEYLGVNEMTLNESKSKVMVFRNGGKPSREDRWYWNGKPLTVTRRYNYLGYPLVSTTKTTQAANFFKGKALAAINATTPILAKSKINSLNSAMKLFDSIVMAVLMYAAPIWATEYKDLLDHIQDTFIRRFLSLPRYTPGYIIRPETGRVSLIITALKLTLKYWLRVLSMDTNRLPRICLTRMRQLSCAT